MKNRRNSIITSRWVTALVFLIVAYSSQVLPLHHVHHFHEDGLLQFEISTHPNEVDVAHSSAHHHGDGDHSHSDEHQDINSQPVNWHTVRISTPRTVTIADQYYPISLPALFTGDHQRSGHDREEPPVISKYQTWCPMFRGPPSLG